MATIPLKKLLQSLRPSFELVPELKHWSPLHRRLNKWCLPLPGSDNYIVRRTQRHLLSLDDKRPVKYKPYIMSPSTFITIQLIVASLLCYFLIKISFTRHLILKYPKLCTFGLVTYDYSNEDVMDDCLFQYEMVGHGWDKGTDLKKTPDKKMIAKISVTGVDPAYISTAVAMIFSAITILKEKDNLPSTSGVMTPGVAFRKTSIIKHLQENGINFEIVK